MSSCAFTVPLNSVGTSGAGQLQGKRVCSHDGRRAKRVPRAVLDSRVSVGFGVETKRTYKVTVIQGNRTSTIEVDGETNLRRALLDDKVDVYTLGGKLRNCGGAGQCGTCLINVEDGVFNTNGRTPREEFLLQNKPDTWRLACRTLVHGDVTVRTKPQA